MPPFFAQIRPLERFIRRRWARVPPRARKRASGQIMKLWRKRKRQNKRGKAPPCRRDAPPPPPPTPICWGAVLMGVFLPCSIVCYVLSMPFVRMMKEVRPIVADQQRATREPPNEQMTSDEPAAHNQTMRTVQTVPRVFNLCRSTNQRPPLRKL